MKSIKSAEVANKKVLVRCDFNVPLDEEGNILDDFKIRETLPTIKYLLAKKAKVVLMSHLGNPEGKVVPYLKLDKVRDRIEKLLEVNIMKSFGVVGRDVENQLSRLKKGEILLLENLRFNKGEIENNAQFAKQLSHLGQIYVNDAFAECHRAYASMVGVPALLPSFAGLLLEKEVKNLGKILKNPKHPLIVIVGGIKIKTKVTKHLEKFEFHLAAETIYHYFWHTFADKIIESYKPRLSGERKYPFGAAIRPSGHGAQGVSEAESPAKALAGGLSGSQKDIFLNQAAAYQTLETILLECLKMLHPFMPFVTEEIFQKFKPGKLLMAEKWD